MTSIGNDIIALKTIDKARTANPRFYSKIISATEQQLYASQFINISFEHFVWLLWSVKESVYKCLQRHEPGLLFSPTKIEVTGLAAPADISPDLTSDTIEATGFQEQRCFRSTVYANSQTFHSRSVIYGDHVIVNVAQSTDNFEHVAWGLKTIVENDHKSQSSEVRTFLVNRLKTIFPGQEPGVGKSPGGFPFITIDGIEAAIPLSLSHHDKYIAYSLTIPSSL